jgi:hypothetical protein
MKKYLPQNIGTSGRIFRLVIAIALLFYAYYEKSWLALAASLFTFFESYMSWCVMYHILGINRCPVKKKKP